MTVPAPASKLPAAAPQDTEEHEGGIADDTINAHDNLNVPSKKIMSMTETSSRVHEPKTYEEAITDPIHSRQWKEAIEE